jgi:hypothetical protein
MEAHLAWLLRDALLKLTVEDRTLGAGPDGKLLIALRPAGVGSGGSVHRRRPDERQRANRPQAGDGLLRPPRRHRRRHSVREHPWRLDRAGALRTRQIAVAMVQTGFVREARVTFVWGPRDQRPSGVVLEADGRVLEEAAAARWLERFNPSLAAAHTEPGLARVNCENCARARGWGRGVVTGGVSQDRAMDLLPCFG